MSAERLRLVVIVGGGLAGLRAAERLCERGYTGRIEIVAREPHAPYRRPALTDGVLPGRATPASVRLRAQLGDQVRWHHGAHAVGLDTARRQVLLDDGRAGDYEGLIIATGMLPRTLPGARRRSDSVFTMRTIDDALQFRAAARKARSVLIVGGGLIGAEAAAALRRTGINVTVLDLAPVLLRDAVGERIGAAMTSVHRRMGVRVETPATVVAWRHTDRGVRAELADGSIVEGDAALVAIGGWPAVGWLEGSGLDVSDGVLCGPTTHVIGADDVVACGDCARWPNLRFDDAPGRVEQWATTIAMARHAADALLDGPDVAAPFVPVPWGWTDQWGLRIHMLGRPLAAPLEPQATASTPLRGAHVARDAEGRLVGAVVVERPDLSVQLHAEIGAACPRPDFAAKAAWAPPPGPSLRPAAAAIDEAIHRGTGTSPSVDRRVVPLRPNQRVRGPVARSG